MRTPSIVVIILVIFGIFAASTAAQYTGDHAERYQKALTEAAGLTSNAQIVQNEIQTQRSRFNQGMASRNLRDREQAKRVFLEYLGRLQRALLAAQNAHNPAIYWGEKYADSLRKVRSTSSQAPRVVTEVQRLRNAQASLRGTERAIQQEAQNASKRR